MSKAIVGLAEVGQRIGRYKTTGNGKPIVVQDDAGVEVGIIDRTTLLKGIKGGKS